MGIMINERSELLLELSHVGGQLHACSNPQVAPLFIDELVDIARQLAVPTDDPRDDTNAFITDPAKISSATWRQCGGLLYALRHDYPHNQVQIAAGVAQRLARLAQTV